MSWGNECCQAWSDLWHRMRSDSWHWDAPWITAAILPPEILMRYQSTELTWPLYLQNWGWLSSWNTCRYLLTNYTGYSSSLWDQMMNMEWVGLDCNANLGQPAVVPELSDAEAHIPGVVTPNSPQPCNARHRWELLWQWGNGWQSVLKFATPNCYCSVGSQFGVGKSIGVQICKVI